MSPIDVNDVEKFTLWLNDLELTKNFGIYPSAISMTSEKEFLEKLAKDHSYSIIESNSHELIGNCGYTDLNHLNQTAEVGIFIGNKEYWGRGYGTEALGLLLDYGFKALNLHNISLRVFSFNQRAIKSYEKVGFKVTGRRRQAFLMAKERYDVICMDILYDEFYDNKK